MKVESKRAFSPVTITLESEKDLKEFINMLSHHYNLEFMDHHTCKFSWMREYKPTEPVNLAMKLKNKLEQV